jgi:hypothetical protein
MTTVNMDDTELSFKINNIIQNKTIDPATIIIEESAIEEPVPNVEESAIEEPVPNVEYGVLFSIEVDWTVTGKYDQYESSLDALTLFSETNIPENFIISEVDCTEELMLDWVQWIFNNSDDIKQSIRRDISFKSAGIGE